MSIEASQRKSLAMAEAYGPLVTALARWPEFKPLAGQVEQRRQELIANKFSIMVLGEFKRGKSTLINAMLGDELLPSKMLPCTAIITVVRYGPSPRFVVVFKDPSREPEVLTPDEFRKKYELQIEDIAKGGGEDALSRAVRDRFDHIDHAVLEFPVELCKNGIEIIDTPGLEEDAGRTERVLESLDRAHAVILVLDASQQFNQREQTFCEVFLARKGLHRRLFVAVNGWNLIRQRVLRARDEKEVEKAAGEVWEMIRHKVFPLVSKGGQDPAERVFKINALGALQHRMGLPDAPGLEGTGVPQLEASLKQFLATERDAARDEHDRNLLADVIGQVHHRLDEQLRIAEKPLEEARGEYRVVEAKLKSLSSKSQSISDYLRGRAHEIAKDVADNLDAYIEREIGGNARGIAAEVSLEEITGYIKIYGSLLDFFRSEEAKFTTEVTRHIRNELERIIAPKLEVWSEGTLVSLLDISANATVKRLEQLIGEYVEERNALEGEEGSRVVGLKADEIRKRINGLLKNLQTGHEVVGDKPMIDLGPIVAGIVAEILLHKIAAFATLGATLIVTAVIAVFRKRQIQQNLGEAIEKGLQENLPNLKLTMKEAVRDRIVAALQSAGDKLKGQLDQEIALISASRQAVMERLESKGFEVERFKAEAAGLRAELDKAAAGVEFVLQKPAAAFAS